jgi:CelD/BcsL family acetyltransferase involved in cellulose biosynthesis
MGKLELRMADSQSWLAWFDMLVRMHTARWQSKGEPGVLADAKVLACHREAIPVLLEQGVLRLGALCFNSEAIAVAYCLVDPIGRPARAQYFYLTTYAMEYAELHPGTLLLALMIEHAAEEGVERIDMLRGEESYKRLWHVESIPTFGFTVRRSVHTERLLSA